MYGYLWLDANQSRSPFIEPSVTNTVKCNMSLYNGPTTVCKNVQQTIMNIGFRILRLYMGS
jgi:hypothetical protein